MWVMTRGRNVQWVLSCRLSSECHAEEAGQDGMGRPACAASCTDTEMNSSGDWLKKSHTIGEVNESTNLGCSQRFMVK